MKPHNTSLNSAAALEPISIDWESIQTVFLDMDGTLLDLHFDNHFWLEHIPVHFARKHDISIDQAKTEFSQMCANIEGTLDWYCIDYWEKKLDMDIIALKNQVADKIAVRHNVEAFLRYLKTKRCHIVLLTNAHRRTVELKFKHATIEPYFNRIITAHDIGFAKEEEGFWDKLHTVESFDIQHSLFIDDNMGVLHAAEQHGIAHLLAIHQPDSQQAPKHTKHYTAIKCFSQLMPQAKSYVS